MDVVVVARRVLGVAVGMAAAGVLREYDDRCNPADESHDRPDRVDDGGERQRGYFFSTTIVLIDAVTPLAISTTTT